MKCAGTPIVYVPCLSIPLSGLIAVVGPGRLLGGVKTV